MHIYPTRRPQLRCTTYLNFIHNIEGILISGIGEDNLDQSVCHPVGCCFAFKGIPEVGMRISHPGMAAKDNETSDGNEDQCQNLDDSDSIGEPIREPGIEEDNCVSVSKCTSHLRSALGVAELTEHGDSVSSYSNSFKLPVCWNVSIDPEQVLGKNWQ
jgi:hypothetical protein